jgi:two-component system phosphate regulon sensor histidine kinase PhoR
MPKFLQSIHDESGRLITLVNDIIKLSQLDENALLADREEIDLYMYADEVIHRLEHVAREKNVSLSLSGEHGSVVGIPSIISEMIYNLCDNAIKYNREGGSVFVSIDKKDGHPAITVRDTGIGIPKDHLDRVFERFYRVDKSHSKEIGGTGLGLSIVKHGAAVHNARVKLSSTVGEGTSVTVIFE